MAISFKGGIKLGGRKTIRTLEAKPLLPCERHVFVLNDHMGAEIFPRVEEGGHVNIGDKLADAEEYTAVPVHSSVSGTVEKIEYNESGQAAAVWVINDKLYTVSEDIKKELNYDKLTKRERLWIIRDAGIMDTDRIPAHLKLAVEKGIKYLVINAVESGTDSGAKSRRILENTDEVMRGVMIARELTGAKKCVIGIDRSFGEGINKIKPFIRYDETTELIAVGSKFPQENKRIIIKTLTGINAPSGKDEADIGVICIDIETLYNIGRVFNDGMPVIERIVSVGGDVLRQNDNFIAPTGVTAQFLFSAAGGFSHEPRQIISGGIYDGESVDPKSAGVTRTTSVFLALGEVKSYEAGECIGCGKCAKVCPAGLLPYKLDKCAKRSDERGMVKYNAKECISCGACSYICPSRIDIKGDIKKMTKNVPRTAGDKHE